MLWGKLTMIGLLIWKCYNGIYEFFTAKGEKEQESIS
jgi:hypothetical protein